MLAALLWAAQPAVADIHDHTLCAPDGVALQGYDVVSYRESSGPVLGRAEFAVQHGELSYHFANAEHLRRFTQAPDAFLPRYLGWCATTISFGRLACPNPLNYKLENGVLLLFETTGFTNGQTMWNSDPIDFTRRANAHLRKLLDGSNP